MAVMEALTAASIASDIYSANKKDQLERKKLAEERKMRLEELRRYGNSQQDQHGMQPIVTQARRIDQQSSLDQRQRQRMQDLILQYNRSHGGN